MVITNNVHKMHIHLLEPWSIYFFQIHLLVTKCIFIMSTLVELTIFPSANIMKNQMQRPKDIQAYLYIKSILDCNKFRVDIIRSPP